MSGFNLGKPDMHVASTKTLSRALAVLGLTAALGATDALADGVFSPFAGNWRGNGRISDVNGKSESLSCKSKLAPAPDGIAMSLGLVCASDSYRVDFHADLYTDGQNLQGTWSETTRNATGNVRGLIRPDYISARTEAPGFTADIVIRVVGGKRLDVSLNAHGTSINRVQVSMKR
jgi:hypothetical protein